MNLGGSADPCVRSSIVTHSDGGAARLFLGVRKQTSGGKRNGRFRAVINVGGRSFRWQGRAVSTGSSWWKAA
jgi:hypothetical protein